MLLVCTENESLPLTCSRGFAFQHVRIHFTGTELSLCLSKWSLRAGLWVRTPCVLWIALLLPVLALCHLYGVKTGVRPSCGSLLSGAPFSGAGCAGDWRGKEKLSGFSGLFCQTSFSDKWLAYLLPFPPFVCRRWVREQIIKLTIMWCVLQPACACTCARIKRRGCLQRKHWIRKGKCQLLSCYCTTILH